jgi:formiminoglutamase
MFKDKLEELLIFFNPVSKDDFQNRSFDVDTYSLGKAILVNYDIAPVKSSDRFEIAILGVCDDSEDTVNPTYTAAFAEREELYKLKRISANMRIADLGNLKTGKDIYSSVLAFQQACALLVQMNVHIIVLGGNQLFTIGNYKALKEFENDINMVVVDSKIDYNPVDTAIGPSTFLNEIVDKEASSVYNIVCMAYQSFFVDQQQLSKWDENYFEHFRLGTVKGNFDEMEAVMRDADLVSFDISAIRLSDAPGQKDGSPNGLYGEEACVISRYAGISDKNKAFGIYGYAASADIGQGTAKLIAQIIWYYLEGYQARKHDYPFSSLANYTKYSVAIDEIEFPIVFYKSNKTQRWWLEVGNMRLEENEDAVIVACSENDYRKACNNEIPERWWINFKKLR